MSHLNTLPGQFISWAELCSMEPHELNARLDDDGGRFERVVPDLLHSLATVTANQDAQTEAA